MFTAADFVGPTHCFIFVSLDELLVLFSESLGVCDSIAHVAWTLAFVNKPVVGFVGADSNVLIVLGRASRRDRWGGLIYLLLFRSTSLLFFEFRGARLPSGSRRRFIWTSGARCFIRIGTAASGTAAYESQSIAADLLSLLCCVLMAIP